MHKYKIEGRQRRVASLVAQSMTETEIAKRLKVDQSTISSTTIYLDALGRTFLTVTHNRFEREGPGGGIETVEEKYATRVKLDIEGNQLEVRDAIVQNGDEHGRIVMRYYYDMLGTQIHHKSMEAGEQWVLNDIMGRSVRMWENPPRQEDDAMQAFEIGIEPSNIHITV